MIDIMRKAKEMQLERVEAMCVDHCRRSLSVHNAVAWFVRAHVHGLEAGVASLRAHQCTRAHSPHPSPCPLNRSHFTGGRAKAWALLYKRKHSSLAVSFLLSHLISRSL